MNVTLSDDISMRKVQDQLFILDRRNSVLHTFNDTGAFLWEQLKAGMKPECLAGALADQFDIGIEDAQVDVNEFLNALERHGLASIRP